MIRFNLGYRHGNNEVEGFSAFRFDATAARAAAITMAREKAKNTPHPFDESRLIFSPAGLTPAEKNLLKADWRGYDNEGPGRSGLNKLVK